jgi:hypothetical protein
LKEFDALNKRKLSYEDQIITEQLRPKDANI